MARKYVALATIVVAAISIFGCKNSTERPASPTEGKGDGGTPPSGFALVDASQFKVSDYKGKVLVLDFWATWCGPCKMEIPHLIELQNEFRERGLVVVGITLDENPDKDVPPYAAQVGMSYANVRGTDALKTEYGIVGLPTIVVYDRAGNQVMKRAGYIEKEVLRQTLMPLLGPASS